jgi:hypothetical protein
MVEGGPIDVLTGDYLAELTLLILLKDRFKDANLGYARTFLRQLEEVAARCLERGIKIVVNAGGLNPAGCAAAARAVYEKLGLRAVVAHVEGDDLMPRLDALQAAGERFVHLDKGTALADLQAPVMSANAYLGGFGIAAALERGADVVICPRVTDAALVVGPAAWRFQWKRDDWDALAGAGSPVTSSSAARNAPAATTRSSTRSAPAPAGVSIAEVRANGSCVITKHPGTGGVVSTGTVTAQLLYEIDSARYLNPDVTARFDTLRLTDLGNDRVRVEGARGEPPPPTTKVCINHFGGWRNSMMVRIPEPQVERKRDIVEETLFEKLGGGEQFAESRVTLRRGDRPDPGSNDEAFAYLTVAVRDPDQQKVGRRFSGGDRDGVGELSRLHRYWAAGRCVAGRRLLAGAGRIGRSRIAS